ncbi:MAG: M50 family metallopeptidase [Bacteroidales bacterium]|nr:M50 family metallopeptidase [Bacteroidales bacterium]
MKDFFETLIHQRTLVFYLILGVVLLLTRIPVAGKYFRSVNTLIHEAGHAFMTLLLSGEVIAINIFADTSGNTVTKASNKFFQVLIAAAGYPLSAIIGFILMFMLSNGYYLYILFFFASLTLLLMVLSIRNGYGLFWAGTFSLLNLLLIYINDGNWIFIAATFFSLIVLTDAVLSSVVLFVITIKTPKKAGDATNLHKFTKVPAVIWSILFLVFSGIMAYLAILKYFPPLKDIISS